jgi:hypothetical protein
MSTPLPAAELLPVYSSVVPIFAIISEYGKMIQMTLKN